jgi:hypothetical protein
MMAFLRSPRLLRLRLRLRACVPIEAADRSFPNPCMLHSFHPSKISGE